MTKCSRIANGSLLFVVAHSKHRHQRLLFAVKANRSLYNQTATKATRSSDYSLAQIASQNWWKFRGGQYLAKSLHRSSSSMTNTQHQILAPAIRSETREAEAETSVTRKPFSSNAFHRQPQEQQQRGHVHNNGLGAPSNVVSPSSSPFLLPQQRRKLTTTTTTATISTRTALDLIGTSVTREPSKRTFSISVGDEKDTNSKQEECSSPSRVNLFANNQLARQNLTMANMQKLVVEPTREHIENIRILLRNINAKDNKDQSISLEKDEASGIGIVCIKSAAKNAISAKMMCDLLDVIDELYAWPDGKGVLIHGHGGFFCSGGDLVSVRELANYEDGLKMATLMQYNMARLQALPMITMALIQGKAIGGGAEIAVTTDLRAMTSESLMGYVHARVGIVAAWGGGSRLVQLIGPSKAVEMMTSGRLVNSNEAIQLGLVNEIIDEQGLSHEQVLAKGRKYLEQHIIGAKTTIMAIKNLVNASRTLSLEQALVVEGQILSSTWGKPAHLEALDNNVKHRGGD